MFARSTAYYPPPPPLPPPSPPTRPPPASPDPPAAPPPLAASPDPPAAPPSLVSPPPPCAFDVGNGRSLCEFSLIVQHDASVSSHAHYGAFAIGGVLTDSSPTQSATVGGHSYVSRMQQDALFHFASGVTVGEPLPFDWSSLEYLARWVLPSTEAGALNHVHVICSGGRHDIGSIHGFGEGYDNRGGYDTLVVFNTAEDIVLAADRNGRAFGASVLAPFSHVTVDAADPYVDGFLIAKSLTMNRNAAGTELHGRCFQQNLACMASTASRDNCGSTSQPTGSTGQSTNPSCSDEMSARKCARKVSKGKCRKARVRNTRCRASCGNCLT